jgi:iron complex outermembrane receptor protein
LFTGVFWNVLDYALEDIERIEVIRGPGAALWGANAVNGVINIVTRDAAQTHGAYLSVGSGNEDPLIATARYGGSAAGADWRVYGKLARRDDQRLASGDAAGDARTRAQAGFRVDGETSASTTWRISGDAFHSVDRLPDRPEGEFTDLNLHGQLGRALAPGSRLQLQAYYRHEYRRVPRQLTHAIDVADIDAQHTWTPHPRHHLVWGGGLRVNWDSTQGSPVIAFEPRTRTAPLTNLFAQDEVMLVPERLFATLGVKYEHNAFSGGEVQPNVRARLMLPRSQMVWGALSRAVRRPTRFEDDVIVFSPTGSVLVRGNDAFMPETLVATEVGYRWSFRAAAFEAAAFRHEFDELRSQDLPSTGLPIIVGNSLEGSSHGVELTGNVQPRPWARFHVSYSWLDTDIRRSPGSRDVSGGTTEANDPHHLFSVRASFDLPRNVEIDALLRAVGELPNPRVPGYGELDLRAAWHPTDRLELWVAGQDLLHSHHPEFGPDAPGRVAFERAGRAGLTVRMGR